MNLDPANLNGAHFEQYFGIWAMHEETFRAAAERINQLDLQIHIDQAQARDKVAARVVEERTDDGLLVLDLAGTLMKFVGSLMEGTSTVFARRVLRAAMVDDEVRAVMLRIDSPGGTVSGTEALAADVAELARHKPVHAYLEDLGASAAYWIASQALRISANPTALVGSIGAFAVVWDMAGAAAQKGIKVHVIRTGAFKGAGQPGTEITAEQLAEWQRLVDELNGHFIAAVMAGRGMSAAEVRGLADGRIHLAKDAQKLGLIDAVQTFDAAMAELRKEKAMGGQNQGSSATVAELKSKFPDSDAQFREDCIEKGLTVEQAASAWQEHRAKTLTEQTTTLSAELEKARTEHAEQVKTFETQVAEVAQERDALKKALAESGSAVAVAAGPDGGGGNAGPGDRAGVIKKARADYAAMGPQDRTIVSARAFVNGALREAAGNRPDPLTDDEARQLGVRNEPED